MHGHSYKLFVSIEGAPEAETGMIVDFDDLSKVVNEKVIAKLDHRFLNDLIPLSTAENISIWIWEQLKPALPALCQIEVFETTDNCVIYRGAWDRPPHFEASAGARVPAAAHGVRGL